MATLQGAQAGSDRRAIGAAAPEADAILPIQPRTVIPSTGKPAESRQD
jgi:hypothetical protein